MIDGMGRSLRLSLMIGVAGAIFCGMAGTAAAATLYVGAGQAYATISNALAAALDGDTIVIATNVQTECGIVITNSVTIEGYGPASTIVQGAASRSNAASGRIFTLNNAAKSVTLANLTIQYGYCTATNGYAYGGAAIYNMAGTITVQNCAITLNDSYLTNSVQVGYGGGAIAQVSAASAMFINNSSLIGNTLGPTNLTALSGGCVLIGGGSLLVDSSYFAFNSCPGKGGAIDGYNGNNYFIFRNSTFFGNQVVNTGAGGGGAIYFAAQPSVGQIYNCTIFSNLCSFGALYCMTNMLVVSSIFASNNTSAGLECEYYGGALITFSNSLLQTTKNSSGAPTWTGNNLTNNFPGLLPPASNGGGTPTCALQAGSPCLDAGANPLGLAYDQRGMGYSRVVNGTADIGACEYGTTANPTCLVYAVTLFAESSANNGTINNTPPMFIQLLNASFNATNGEDLVASGKLQVANPPSGITFVAQQINSNMLNVAAVGAALHHNSSNSIANLTFTFTDAAFSNVVGGAAAVLNSTASSLQVQFIDPVLTWSGTNFIETVYNDGSIMPLSIALVGDVLTGANGDDFVAASKVAVSNVPSGLTAAITRTSPTNLIAALTGNARQHNAVNSVSNLVVVFQTSAFSNTVGNAVANYAKTNLFINYMNNPVTNYVATGGSDTTGNGTLASPWATISNAHAHCRAAASDVIRLGPGAFTQSNNVITGSVVIQGAGAGVTVVQGASARSNSPIPGTVFVMNGSAGQVCTLSDMTIQYGYSTKAYSGGGVSVGVVGTTCTVARCMFAFNDQNVNHGSGGIYQGQGTTLIVSNCTFATNTGWQCGGIAAELTASWGASTVYGCTFVANSGIGTAVGSGAFTGGTNCTVMNSTFLQNFGTANAAVLVPVGLIANCTVVSNSAGTHFGAGIAGGTLSHPLLVQNTLCWTNLGTTGVEDVWAATAGSLVATNCWLSSTNLTSGSIITNCILGANPMIGPLVNNGGYTLTMAITNAASACVGAASKLTALPYDQRGYLRDSAPDIGAFEYGAHPPSPAGTTVTFR